MISGFDLFFALFNNLAIFIALVGVYGYLLVSTIKLKWYSRKALVGVAFGVFAIGCMYAKIPVFKGVIVDQRNAIIALSGVVGGPLAGYISAALAGLFRLHLGGQGAFAGVVGVTLAATSGVILSRFPNPFGSVSRAAFSSLFATIFILPGFLFVGDLQTGFKLMVSMSGPYGLAIYIGIFLVGLLLDREINKIRVEQLLSASEKRFHTMFRNHDTAMLLLNPAEMEIVDANNAALSFYGYSIEEMRGKALSEINESDPKEVSAALKKIRQGEQGYFEFDHKLANGDTRHVEIHASPVEIDNQILVFSIIHDATYREKMMAEQKRSAQLAALGTVAAGVAHEVNNPIQGIMNYATIIQKAPEQKDKVVELSGRIIKESDRIARITKDLLYYSKDNSSEIIDSNISELVASAISLMETKCRRLGLHIETNFDEGAPRLPVQPQGIQQIVINLVDNAIDALIVEKSGVKNKAISVKVGLLKIGKPHHVFIEVYDQGIGMPESVKNRAKELFYSTKPSSQGTGIGLAIVNDIVTDHGGQLVIDSKDGEYTKITAFLPVEEAQG